MNKPTFVLLTASSIIFSLVLSSCSERDAENTSSRSETAQLESGTAASMPAGHENHSVTYDVDKPMDYVDSEHKHGAGEHDSMAAPEELEGKKHEHGMHMQGDHWNAPVEASRLSNPVAADSASIQRGRDLYLNNCASCHGSTGRGDGSIAAALTPKPADLVVMAPMHPAGDFFWKIENGRGPMPAWKNTLGESQIWDIVNYIKSLGETASRETGRVESDGHDHAH